MALTAPPPLTNPYAIFAKARQHWQAARYPAQVSYRIVVTVARHGVTSSAHYDSYYDSALDQVHVAAVSDEERMSAYIPRGINTFLELFGGRIPMSAPQRTFDYLGVPVLAPNYSFGVADYQPRAGELGGKALVRRIRREFHDESKLQTVPPQDSGLKTIADIEVIEQRYVIALRGLAGIGDHQDYDLVLRPVSEPDRYRLREMWVDAQSFATDRLIVQGNFTQGGMTGVPWTVTFGDTGGSPYIASETTASPFSLVRHSYDAASITFQNVRPTHIPWSARWAAFAVNAETGVPPLAEP